MRCYPVVSVLACGFLLASVVEAQPLRKPRPGGWRSGGGADQHQKPALGKDAAEQKTLQAIETMREGPRYANVASADGRLLRMLAETTGAKRVVEIGTSTGESGTWLALGVRKTGGHVYTHEIDEERAQVAQANFKKAGVDEAVTIIMGDAHETVLRYTDADDELFVDTKKGEYIDILFLDADKSGYIDYLKKLVPLVRPGGLIIAHNMVYPTPDPDYLKAITKNPEFETLFLLMEGAGVGVTMKKR
jgi:predicted O-methyltransferase YrrM